MKSVVYKGLLLCGILAPVSDAGVSLADSAPLIGVPDSYAIRYNAYVNVGFDDNLNNSEHDEKKGGFVRFGVGASYADYESVSRLSYDASIGAQLYNKDSNGTQDRFFSDIHLGARFSHSFAADRTYACSMSLSYTPDPEYSHAYTSAHSHGDCLMWSLSNTYSQGIDERWSWNASVGFSGSDYSESEYSDDDRYYLSATAGLAYAADPRTTFGVNMSYRFDSRSMGYDSENLYLIGYVRHLLSPISSCYLSLGTQMKYVDSEINFYPSFSASYRRELTEGLSANVYASLDNENVGTYERTTGGSFLSDLTWRVGCSLTYAYTPTVSFVGGVSLVESDYSKGTNRLRDTNRTAWTANVGMRYAFTETVTGNINYSYTSSDGYGYNYDRSVISTGVNYSF